jgi:hypothetical protein
MEIAKAEEIQREERGPAASTPGRGRGPSTEGDCAEESSEEAETQEAD